MRKSENRNWHPKEEMKWAQVHKLLGESRLMLLLYAELLLYFAQKMFNIYQFVTCIMITFIKLHTTYKNNLQV